MSTNDNDSTMVRAVSPLSDGHGHAALLLVESLIHGLCEASILTAGQAVEIAERAAHILAEHARAADGVAAPMWRSHTLLLSIAASLKTDDRGGSLSPHPVT